MANYNLTQTGAEVQVILDRVAAGYIYMGTADLTTTPDTTNPDVCYLLAAVGTYTNFGNIAHASGIGIALWNGSAWSYQNVPSSAVVPTDATPMEGSVNPVQSGGVYEKDMEIEAKIDGIGGYADIESTFIITTTPSGYTELTKLSKMYGNSILWNQMTYGHFVNNVHAPWNLLSVTKVSCADGIIKISPTAAGKTARIYRTLSLTSGHKYCCRYWLKINTSAAANILASWGYFNGTTVNILRDTRPTNQWFQVNRVVTPSDTATQIHVGMYGGDTTISTTDSVEIKDINVFDLTLMFGSGNEPTADGFLQMYPNDYYEPTASTIKNVCPTKLTSTNRTSTFELDLTNYNLASVGETRDELDLEGGILTRKIGSRAYQSGDESDTSVLTDNTTTLYVLQSETTQSISQQNILRTFENGTLSFSASGIIAPVPTIMAYGIDPSTSLQHGEQAYQDCLTYERLIKTTAYTTTPTADRYINYSTGNLANAGAVTQMEMYRVPLDGVLLLDVYVGALDTVPAAIAYYKSTTISADNYMQSASVQMIAGAHLYQSAVPEGAVLAVVSNRKINVPNPIIKVTRADSILTPIETSVLKTAKSKEYQYSPIDFAPFYAHHNPITFLKDPSNNKLFYGESLPSIDFAARLGFKFIEANIHKTSDNHYVVIHGIETTFGSNSDFTALNGADISTLDISQLTLSYIQDYIRYNSAWSKYQTTIPTLEEFLQRCAERNIGIVAGTSDETAINLCRKYLGNKVILYNSGIAARNYFNGLIFYWNNVSGATIDTLLAQAQSYGRPFVCEIGPTVVSEFKTQGILADFVKTMHENNFMVGFSADYQGESSTRELMQLGFDFAASAQEVNRFEGGIIYDLNDPSNITSSATITNGKVSLPTNGTIVCGENTTIPLGKAMLTMVFDGELTINFGHKGSRTISSNGDEEIVLSDYALLSTLKLTITATEATDISEVVYQTMEC